MNNPNAISPAASPSVVRRAVRFRASDRPRRAFTLVELTVVATIMSSVLGVGAVMYSRSLVHSRIASAAHRLAADIRAAQSAARTGSQTVSITLDAGSGTYKITRSGDGGTSTIDLRDEPYHAYIAAADAGAGAGILTFDGYGRPDAQATVKLCVGDTCKTISVSAETGRVQID